MTTIKQFFLALLAAIVLPCFSPRSGSRDLLPVSWQAAHHLFGDVENDDGRCCRKNREFFSWLACFSSGSMLALVLKPGLGQ
jgi:hypothetical protein